MMSGDEIEEKSDVPRKLTAAEKKREQVPKAERRRDSDGKYAAFINS